VVTNGVDGNRFYRLARWNTLFDGTQTSAFRRYKQLDFPANRWTITSNGELMTLPSALSSTNDLVTVETYEDFELFWEWRTSTNGNSGVIFRVTEPSGINNSAAQTGPEYQLFDDAHANTNNVDDEGWMGDAYGLFSAANKVLAPTLGWNQCRLTVLSNHVVHWLNGRNILEYDIGTVEWGTEVMKYPGGSRPLPGFGEIVPSRIALQHHGERVWYRNIRIRRLPVQ
jgi:hypothetical protein